MGRFAALLFVVSGTVALQVVAQAVLVVSVRFISRRTRGATELRRTFWISLGAVLPLFFGHFAQVGLWAGVLVLLGALQTYNDAFYFSLVTFATLGYGDIVLAPGYRIFGALGATCGSLMLGWSTALIFAAISRQEDRGRA
jgi:ion channel